MDEESFRTALREFTGTSCYYQHLSRKLLYTEGVQFLAEHGRLHWLIDLIASWQPRALEDPALREFQLWELRIGERESVAVCLRDVDDEAFRQVLRSADSALDFVRLYVENGVLLLPSEH